MSEDQQRITHEVLELARAIEPLQKRINELAEEDLKLKGTEDWDKDASESIQSWRTYD